MVNVRVDDGSFLASVITIIITVVVDFFLFTCASCFEAFASTPSTTYYYCKNDCLRHRVTKNKHTVAHRDCCVAIRQQSEIGIVFMYAPGTHPERENKD